MALTIPIENIDFRQLRKKIAAEIAAERRLSKLISQGFAPPEGTEGFGIPREFVPPAQAASPLGLAAPTPTPTPTLTPTPAPTLTPTPAPTPPAPSPLPAAGTYTGVSPAPTAATTAVPTATPVVTPKREEVGTFERRIPSKVKSPQIQTALEEAGLLESSGEVIALLKRREALSKFQEQVDRLGIVAVEDRQRTAEQLAFLMRPLDAFSETVAELLEQIPKLFTGNIGDIEAPTLFTKGFMASVEKFRDRSVAQQIVLGFLDPSIFFGLFKVGIGATRVVTKSLVLSKIREAAPNLGRGATESLSESIVGRMRTWVPTERATVQFPGTGPFEIPTQGVIRSTDNPGLLIPKPYDIERMRTWVPVVEDVRPAAGRTQVVSNPEIQTILGPNELFDIRDIRQGRQRKERWRIFRKGTNEPVLLSTSGTTNEFSSLSDAKSAANQLASNAENNPSLRRPDGSNFDFGTNVLRDEFAVRGEGLAEPPSLPAATAITGPVAPGARVAPAGRTQVVIRTELDEIERQIDANFNKRFARDPETMHPTLDEANELGRLKEQEGHLIDELGQILHPDPVMPWEISPGVFKEAAPKVTHALEQAEAFLTIDAPGFVGGAMDKIPGISNLQAYLRPANKLPTNIQNAWVASGGERAAFATDQFPSRSRIFQQIDDLFGSRSSRIVDESGRSVRGPSPVEGGRTNVKFIGPETERVGIEGTIFDIAQRPQFYDLTDEMKSFLVEWQTRQSGFQQELIQGYGAKVGEFIPAQEGSVFLRNVDRGQEMLTAMRLSEEQAIRQGAGKTRVFETAADRIKDNPDFSPVVDIRKLQSGMDEYRANVAGTEVFKEGIGGMTKVQAVASKHPDLLKLKNDLTKIIDNLKSRLITVERQIITAGGEVNRTSTALNRIIEKTNPLLDNVDGLVLLKSEGWGPELSFLSGQIRELLQQAAALERRGTVLTERGIAGLTTRQSILDQLDTLGPKLGEVRRRYEAADLRPLEFVEEGIFLYLPADQARAVRELSLYNSSHWVSFLDNMRGGIFAADFSPIAGVQLPLSFLFQPHRAIPRLVGASKNSVQARDLLNIFRESTMLKAVEANPKLARDFAFWSGFPVQTGTPKEFSGGFLRLINPTILGKRIPFGEKFQVANERMYSIVLRQSLDLFEHTTKRLNAAGVVGDNAGVIAADMATKVFPMWNPYRLGLSQSRAAAIRALPTSVSFIMNPTALVQSATTGFAKIALKQTLTPQEKISVQLIITAAGSAMAMSVPSAAIDALIRGNDPIQAIKNATDPTHSKFLCLFLPGTGRCAPLGGPFRGVIKAIVPREVDWAPVPIPFANIVNYWLNRVNPWLQGQIRLIRNRDFYGGEILKGELPERVLRGLLWEMESSIPLVGAAAVGGLRRGLEIEDILEQTAAQALGINLGQETPFQQQDLAVQRWAKEQGIEGKVFQLNINGETIEAGQSGKITSFYDLAPSDRQGFEADNPGIVAARKQETKRQAEQDIGFAVIRQDAEELKDASQTDQLADDDLLTNGDISPTEWREKRRTRRDSLNDKRAQIYSDLDTREPETVLDYYYAEFDRIKTQFNNVMTDDAWQTLEFWIESQPLETQQFIDTNTGLAPMTPKEQEYKADLADLHPYFDIRDYIIRERQTFGITESLAKQYQEWLDAGPGDRATIQRSNPAIGKIESKLVPGLQFLMRIQNRDIDLLVRKWEYSTTLPRHPGNLRDLLGATP